MAYNSFFFMYICRRKQSNLNYCKMRKFVLTNLFLLVGILAHAQTDVSKYYLANYDFNQYFDYTASQSTAVAQELLDVKGWTADLSANYTIVGTYEYGFGGTFNGASVPKAG